MKKITDTTASFTRTIDTPLGPVAASASSQGIVRLVFQDEQPDGDSPISKHPQLLALERQLAEYFAGERTEFTLPLAPSGSDFEMRAWQYLRTIPFGQTRSYGQQARAIADLSASRAVGRANGANRIAILIPCHRVIGADGSLTGFAAGIERKRWLLDHERAVAGGSLFSTCDAIASQ